MYNVRTPVVVVLWFLIPKNMTSFQKPGPNQANGFSRLGEFPEVFLRTSARQGHFRRRAPRAEAPFRGGHAVQGRRIRSLASNNLSPNSAQNLSGCASK